MPPSSKLCAKCNKEVFGKQLVRCNFCQAKSHAACYNVLLQDVGAFERTFVCRRLRRDDTTVASPCAQTQAATNVDAEESASEEDDVSHTDIVTTLNEYFEFENITKSARGSILAKLYTALREVRSGNREILVEMHSVTENVTATKSECQGLRSEVGSL